MARTVAVDFDGVLHPYTDGWIGSVPADEPPMEGAAEFLSGLVGAGYRVVVFSTRCDHEAGLSGTVTWLHQHGLFRWVDEVTHMKPPAVAYVDDRAVPFNRDEGFASCVAAIERLAAGRAHGAAP